MRIRCTAGPPGYGGECEGNVGDQLPEEVDPPTDRGGPKGKTEPGNPPSDLEKDIDVERTGEPPVGVPVDQTE